MKNNMVREWLDVYADDVPEPSSSVQSREQMLDKLKQRIQGCNLVADVFYDKWISMVKR